jgi:hypothetical protein
MQIAYYDEAGDDGFPKYSSPLFVLTCLYIHHLNWKAALGEIKRFRRDLANRLPFPAKVEVHTRHFLLNKNPYRQFNITDTQRIEIIDLLCDLVGSLEARVVNVAIVKPRILRSDYQVLDTALTYSVQRIENDLKPTVNPTERFLIITDPGRVGKMRKTTRRVQKINYIPSKFGPTSYRNEIKSLIEDPLPKDSSESHFIQLADMISYVVYLHLGATTHAAPFPPSRLPRAVDTDKLIDWLERLKPSLNLQASSSDPYGIVIYPRQK